MMNVFKWGKNASKTQPPADAPDDTAPPENNAETGMSKDSGRVSKKRKSAKGKKSKKSGKATTSAPAASSAPSPAATSKKTAAAAAASPTSSPLSDETGMRHFLRRAEPLDVKKHGHLRVMEGQDFHYVSQLHTVPLSAIEFMPLARHCPIIFAGEEQVQPVALMGLRPKENLFVEEGGRWTTGCYIPAILRRAPFVLIQDSKGGKSGVSLSLDVESPLVSDTKGTPLFKDGNPTPLVAKMATFAASYSKEQARTRVFVDALLEQRLLVERKMEITLATGQKISFSGIRVIDEDRLRQLDDAVAVEWFRRGWITLAVSHILSLANMGRLHHRANTRALAAG